MNKIGLTPSYYIITLLGYVVMIVVYAIFLRENWKTNNYGIVFGSLLVLYGYTLLLYEYSKEWQIAISEEYRRRIDYTHAKGGDTTEAKENKIFQSVELGLVTKHFFKGRAVLIFFHVLSFILPINEHLKMTDITAIFGQFMVYTDNYLTFGYILLFIYYLLYFIRNYKESHKYFVNKLQMVGSSMLIYHYFKNISYMLSL
jgi:hypothetical protein